MTRFISSRSLRLPTPIVRSVATRVRTLIRSGPAPGPARLPTRATVPRMASASIDWAIAPPTSTIRSTPRSSVSLRTAAPQSGVST